MASEITRYRVFNRCKYDIGVTLTSGMQVNIRPGMFQLMTDDDIMMIETSCRDKRFFSQKMLVPTDKTGKDIPLEMIGIVEDKEHEHKSDEDIIAALKQPVKKFEAWLDGITDEEELHGIYEVAKGIDLPKSKLTILNDKMPNKDWLDELK